MKHYSILIFLLCTFYPRNSAYGFFCFKGKDKLKNLPVEIAASFTFDPYNGASFGTEKKMKSYLKTIRNCAQKIDDIGLRNCLNNDILPVLETSYRRKKNKWSSLSFEMKDKDYFKYTPKDALKLPDELKNGLPDNWRELVSENEDWTGLEYSSRTVGNPPLPNTSYNRVLIKVDEPPYDKWIQFTIPQKCTPRESIIRNGLACDKTGAMREVPSYFDSSDFNEDMNKYPEFVKQERLIDYIAVNTEESPQKIYFNQLWRDKNGKNPVRRDKAKQTFDRCYTCHPNGMRQLSPLPSSVSREDLPALEELQGKIDEYGQLDWGPAINPKGYGPPMGREQGCTQCHNNQDRGAINHMTEMGHIMHKVHGDFSMNGAKRKKHRDFQRDMMDIGLYISEEDRKQIHEKILEEENQGRSIAYETILDYIEDKKLSVPFDVKEYRAILNTLQKKNENFSAYDLLKDYDQEFREHLFARCGLVMTPAPFENVYDGESTEPVLTPIDNNQSTQGEGYDQ